MDYDAQIKNLSAQLQAVDADVQQKTVLKFKLMGAIEILTALKQAEQPPVPSNMTELPPPEKEA